MPRKPSSEFSRAVADAKPLKDRERLVRPSARKSGAEARGREHGFVFPDPGQELLACATDADRRTFDRLRKGRIPAGVTADLHGLRKTEARRALARVLQQAWEAGEDCVLVIHGRGLGSESEPVLKRALPGWLTTPPLAPHVLAFAPARPEDGGSGATCVLLRGE